MFTVEDGTGLANANSYTSVQEANDYHEFNAYGSAWRGSTYDDDQKMRGLVTATRYLDANAMFIGTRRHTRQALEFPRWLDVQDLTTLAMGNSSVLNVVPQDIKDITSALALLILAGDIETIANAIGVGGGQVTGITLGSLSLSLSSPTRNRQPTPSLIPNSIIILLDKWQDDFFGSMSRVSQ